MSECQEAKNEYEKAYLLMKQSCEKLKNLTELAKKVCAKDITTEECRKAFNKAKKYNEICKENIKQSEFKKLDAKNICSSVEN